MEAPQSRPTIMTMILPAATRSETSALRAAGSSIWRAAMTCGMPLPCEFGNTERATNTATKNPPGVTRSAQYSDRSISRWKIACALSATTAISTAAPPTQRPPSRKVARRTH